MATRPYAVQRADSWQQGASGGIGFAITQLFLGQYGVALFKGYPDGLRYEEQGALVTAHYNTQPRGLLELQRGAEYQDKLSLVKGDLASEKDVDEVFKNAREQLGDVTILISEQTTKGWDMSA